MNSVSNANVTFTQPKNSGLNDTKSKLTTIEEQKRNDEANIDNIQQFAGRVEIKIGDLSTD